MNGTMTTMDCTQKKKQTPPFTCQIEYSSPEEMGASFLIGLKNRILSREEFLVTSELCYSIISTETDHSLTNSSCTPKCDNSEENSTESTNKRKSILKSKVEECSPAMPAPLATPRDAEFLSPLQCYIREFCTEYFAATKEDIVSNGKSSGSKSRKGVGFVTPGRRTPVAAGRVGIRCVFCKNLPAHERTSQAISFPSQVNGIYSSIVMMQCRHFPHCKGMPESVREHIVKLKRAGNSSPNPFGARRQQYWADSARGSGFIDTSTGIRFAPNKNQGDSNDGNDNQSNEIITTGDHVNEAVSNKVTPETTPEARRPKVVSPVESVVSLPASIAYDLLIQGSDLVSIEDKDLVPGHVFLALAQMKPCRLGEDDRVGCYKTREIGFSGMCCKHCEGHPGPGFGKFFPNSVRSLAQTTTTQTIVKHIAFKCRKCPKNIKDAVSTLMNEAHNDTKPAYVSRRSNFDGRPKYGSRKTFFQRVWDRLHGRENNGETDAFSEYGSVATATSSQDMNPSPRKKLFHPIQQVVSLSSNSDAGSDVSFRGESDNEDVGLSDDEPFSVDGTNPYKNLIDDKNRRVTIRLGNTTSTHTSRKRPSSHPVTGPRKRAKREH